MLNMLPIKLVHQYLHRRIWLDWLQ